MKSQTIISGKGSITGIGDILLSLGCRKYMLVCDSSFQYLNIKDSFAELNVPHVVFSGFTPNPLYEDVCRGVEIFRKSGCDTIVAVGGGSSLDVAKCIKLYCKMDSSVNYLTQEYKETGIPLIAVPTTAGTGSESTRFAVIYFEGKKQSVAHESIIPNYAVLEPSVLKTLPVYQKKCTVLDALCQGMESWWSVNSDLESREYSKAAVETIIKYGDEYIFENTDESAEKMMVAANLAGKAINITQTTAAHAMSYKLTSLYGIPHGHAVAVCLAPLWRYMQRNTALCIDGRGKKHLECVFDGISRALGADSWSGGSDIFENILIRWDMKSPVSADLAVELETLCSSVNPIRLKNNPVGLSDEAIKELYSAIVRDGKERREET